MQTPSATTDSIDGQNHTTETRIYRSAVGLFSELGYHGTSLRAIANDVGIQMSSLYYYFSSKQDVLFTIMHRTLGELNTHVQQATADIDNPAQRLRTIVVAHVEFHAKHQEEALVTDSELRALDADNRATVVGMRDDYELFVRSTIEAGIKQGLFNVRAERIATFAIMTMCTGIVSWYREDGALSASEIASNMAEFALAMVTNG